MQTSLLHLPNEILQLIVNRRGIYRGIALRVCKELSQALLGTRWESHSYSIRNVVKSKAYAVFNWIVGQGYELSGIRRIWEWAKGHATKFAKHGHIDAIKWIAEIDKTFTVDRRMLTVAIAAGQLEMTAYLLSGQNTKFMQMATYIAAEYGNTSVLAMITHQGYELDVRVCSIAAMHGQLEVIRWARSRGYPWNAHVFKLAARNGHVEVLKWARDNDCPWYHAVDTVAVEDGHINVLEWMCHHTSIDVTSIRNIAAKNGCVDVLAWIITKYPECLVTGMYFRAIAGKQWYVVKWLWNHGCPCDKRVLKYVVETSLEPKPILDWLISKKAPGYEKYM